MEQIEPKEEINLDFVQQHVVSTLPRIHSLLTIISIIMLRLNEFLFYYFVLSHTQY